MNTYTYDASESDDKPREAGEFRCPGCLCRRVFWVADGHEYNEEPDLECAVCGFMFTTFRDEKSNKIGHQLSRELRDQALEELIQKRQGELIRAGFVKEDVDRVFSTSD